MWGLFGSSTGPSEMVKKYVEQAASKNSTEPDWETIILLAANIINEDPGQAKHALKVLMRRLKSNANAQLLALGVLEALSKNCSDRISKQIVEEGILNEMVKISNKSPDKGVRDKILDMIYAWKHDFGGEYDTEYQKLKAAGVEFPPLKRNNASLSTASSSRHIADSAISFQVIEEAADRLHLMLSAFDHKNQKGLEQSETVADLVRQCRSYEKQAIEILQHTENDELLSLGPTVIEKIQLILKRYDDIMKKTAPTAVASATPPVNTDDQGDEVHHHPSFSWTASRLINHHGDIRVHCHTDASESTVTPMDQRLINPANAPEMTRKNTLPPPDSSSSGKSNEEEHRPANTPPILVREPSLSPPRGNPPPGIFTGKK